MTANEFWNWFSLNNSKYLFLIEVDPIEKEKLLDEFQQTLHEYCEELHFEIGTSERDQEVIITAEGKREYFDLVEELVSHAPQLKDWVFIALKQASGFKHTIEYMGVKYDPSQLWFLPLESKKNPGDLGIRVGHQMFDFEQHDTILWATYLLIHKCLGEKSSTFDIQHVEVDSLPENPGEKGYIEFVELQKYISWKKKKRKDHPQ
jgi:hypothetical protein